MDINDIIKNPILIGLIAGLLAYMYLKWKTDKYNKKNCKKKKVNLLIPFAIFAVFWFVSYAYFSFDENENTSNITIGGNLEQNNTQNKAIITKNNIIQNNAQPIIKRLSETSEPHSFNLVSNGVQIPSNLPDIFFEMN